MKLFNQIFLFFILLLALSCGKEEVTPVTPPGNNDTTKPYYGTPFENMPPVEDIVMYEVNLRAFSVSGDLQGVINRLDNLKDLGINVIWLMPIHPIGEINSVNSPYSVKDYKAVSPEYGSLQDLRKLTDEAHARDMAVILDMVANHTAWDNPWISNKSWYTQDASGNIVHPPGTNWLDVADLNFDNHDMRQSMISVMKYWILEANIDGYRCDYADGVPADFWKQALDTLANIPNRDYLFLAEGTRANHFSVGFDLIYGWDFYGTMKNVFNGVDASNLINVHVNEYSNTPAGKQRLRFTTNHDESAWDATPMVLFEGKEGALAASVVTIFMGGVPMLYTGQEVGTVENVPFFSNSVIQWDDNPDMLQLYKDLLNFYNQSDVARKGLNTYFPDNDVICFKKILDDEVLLIIANLQGNQLVYLLPDDLKNTSWTNVFNEEQVSFQNILQMDAYEYLILE